MDTTEEQEFTGPPSLLSEEDSDLFAGPPDEVGDMVDEIETEKAIARLEDERNLTKIGKIVRKHGSGIYAKFYFINAAGESVNFYKLENIEDEHIDMEGVLKGLIEENNDWPGGKWKVLLFDNKHKIRGTLVYNFKPKPKALAPANDSSEVTKQALEQNQNLVDKMLTIAQDGKGDDTLLVEMLRSMKQDPTQELEKMAMMMKLLNPPKQDNSEIIKTLILAVVPLVGEILKGKKEKAPSLMEQAGQLKELGILNSANPQHAFNDSLDMFSRITELVGNMQPGSGDKWSEVIKAIGPHVGKVLSNVAEGAKELVQLKREALALNVGMKGRRQLPSPVEEAENEMTGEDTTSMNPMVAGIYNAVKADDKTYYPELERLIRSPLIGQEVYDGLIAGTVQPSQLVAQIAPLASQFREPGMPEAMAAYLEGFVLAKLEEMEANQLITQCSKCSNPVAFDSVEDFENDDEGGICGKEVDGVKCDGILMVPDKEEEVDPTEENTAQTVDKSVAVGSNGQGQGTEESEVKEP